MNELEDQAFRHQKRTIKKKSGLSEKDGGVGNKAEASSQKYIKEENTTNTTKPEKGPKD